MSGRKKPKGGRRAETQAKALPAVADLIKAMDGLETAEALNSGAVAPFITALEDICRARGYVLNIYGEGANLAVTGDSEAAEALYEIIENYLDARGAGGD
ncbi:MAG: hypothetical protein ACYYKD_13570 [Rhodospirillales bacterium]